jgi:phosphoglycerate dehydrogenase-like enzyme
MSGAKPLILFDPLPRTLQMCFSPAAQARLHELGRLIVHEQGRMPAELVERHLADVAVVIGQTDLPDERLARAPKLRAIFNIEGNFLPNVDYPSCFRRSIWVLNASPVFAQTVAEMALGMMLDLARDISAADRAFREGRELYGLESNGEAFLIQNQPVGLIGFGDLGRAFRRLLVPFGCAVKVFDPWLPDLLIRDHGCQPAGLDELLASSRIIVVFAAVTAENRAMLGRRELALIRPGSLFLLMSRAAVVDFEALVEAVAERRFKAATDVFPEEPWPKDHPVRRLEGMLLSAHRAGALDEVFKRIGDLVLADLELILRGLPPVMCKRAEPETVARLRSMPVAKS